MVIPPEDIKYLLASSFLEDSSIGLANGKMGGVHLLFLPQSHLPSFPLQENSRRTSRTSI